MKEFKTYLILIILAAVLSGQVVWNDPPEYYYYENQNRWVEVILPTPQNLSASTVNNSQVKLKWNEYWTQALLDAYLNKFGYAAIPNRFSLYRQNITNGDLQLQAIPGVPWDKIEYIDTNVEFGKEYLYKIMAQDQNYQIVGGLQHWSPRSLPTTVTVGGNLSSPYNFTGYYEPDSEMIILSWDYVSNATSYIIFKSFVDSINGDPNNDNWLYLSIPIGNVNEYFDSDLSPYVGYVYDIIAVNGNIKSLRSTNRLTINSGTLSIEDEEYWEIVEEYEKDRKIGWFGCSKKQ